MKSLRLVLLLLLAGGHVSAQSYDPATSGREGVVLIANQNIPQGVELARYYARLRGVPEDRILMLDLPVEESLSRGDYERRLRDPLLALLREKKLAEQVRRDPAHVAEHDSGWTTVQCRLRYFVVFYGVPLRIEDTKPWPLDKVASLVNHGIQRDEAAVDSELCLVLQESYDLRGRVANPQYNQLRWETPASGAPMIMVGRLDGPDPEQVRAMIDHALYAERFGLQGRAYVDLRAPHLDDYRVGDYWLEESAQRLQREGYDVVMERTDAVFGDLYPMDDAALYLGWYTEQVTGPFARTNFHFRAGAVAYHNHSGNARTLRSASVNWTGPLLARGATASMGAVSEPFLHFTPHLPILTDRLCNGAPWADAVYLSMIALSWQTTVLGDPLYRPFAVPLEEQIRRLEEAGDPAADWAHARRVNQLVREGRLNVALRYLRERLRLRENVVLREKLADLYAINELYDESFTQYDQVLLHAPSAEYAVRVGSRYLSLLDVLGKKAQRAKVKKQLRERWAGSRFLASLPGAAP